MTYQVESAIGRKQGNSGYWEEIDILDMNTRNILLDYSEVRVNIINRYRTDGKTEGLDLEDIRALLTEHVGTFEEFLISLGNNSLPTTLIKYGLKEKKVKYRDLFRAGYKAKPVNENFSTDADLPREDKTSIYLAKNDIDYKDFHDHCLVTVNGLLHYVDYSHEGLWVLDGMKNVNRINNNHMGVINFKELGKIKTKLITDDMIYSHNNTVGLFNDCVVDVGEDITEKTMLVSIGGYLHVADAKAITIVGMSQFKINWDRVPIAKRIMDSGNSIDFNDLGLEGNLDDYDGTFTYAEDYQGDAFLRNYLCSNNSFIILLDNKHVYVDREPVTKTCLPGSYTHREEPKAPLYVGVGKLAEYWTMEEDDIWSVDISTDCCDYKFFNFKTVAASEHFAIDNSLVPNRMAVLTTATLLHILSNYSEETQ